MTVVWTILLWVVWAAALGLGLILTLFALAFGGDAPKANRALQRAISVGFTWLVVAILLSLSLMTMRSWWSVPLAYLLLLTPPFVLLGTASILMRRHAHPQAGVHSESDESRRSCD